MNLDPEKRQRLYDLLVDYADQGEIVSSVTLARESGLALATVKDYLVRLRRDGIIDWTLYREGRVYIILKYEDLPESGYCELCRCDISEHLRCAGCGVLVGPRHVERVCDLADGRCACCQGVICTWDMVPTEILAVVRSRRMRWAA